MLFLRISWLSRKFFLDLGFIVLVNLILLTFCYKQSSAKNVSASNSNLEQKTHRTQPNNETAPMPIVQELGNLLSWFFHSPDPKDNQYSSTPPAPPKIHSTLAGSSTLRPTAIPTTTNVNTERLAPKIISSEDVTPQRRLNAVPRSRVARSNNPSKSSNSTGRQIQITDIQTSIGTELPEDDHMEDPSQINLQDELESIDKFEKKVSQDPNQHQKSAKQKRDIPIHGIKRPYINPGNTNFQRTFANRQGFLIDPAQHVLALRQQQAAALLQQEALRQGIGYRRPFFYDDYDDSDYDDSDSLEDDDSFGFFNPVRDSMRRGQFFPPRAPFLGGIGRRSVDEQLSKSHHDNENDNQNHHYQTVESPALKIKAPRKKSFKGTLRRDGEWTLIDDYDLSSDFHKFRKGSPFGRGRQDHLEEDENNISVKNDGIAASANKKSGKGKPCEGKRCKKQDDSETTTTSAPLLPGGGGLPSVVPGVTTTFPILNPGGDNSSTPLPPTAPEGENSTNPIPTALPVNSTLSSTTPATNNNSSLMSSSTTVSPSEGSSSTSTAKPMGQRPPYKANANCRCGAQSIRGEMITRGTVIRVQTNPWLFAISQKNKHLCTGTLINNRYVLTAAQCVQGVNKKHLTVMGGLATRSSLNFTVSKIIVHPHYSPSESSAHDLALLRLTNVVEINQMTRPICLPLSAQSRAATFTSGTLNTWIRKSSQLQMLQTDVKVSGHAKCNTTVMDYARGQLCASPPGKTECGGDSGGRGGSLQVTSGEFAYDQIGVVASTIGCRSSNSPGVYTDIRNYTRWILTETKDAKYCNKPKIKPTDLAALEDIESRSDFDESEEEEDDEEDFDNIF